MSEKAFIVSSSDIQKDKQYFSWIRDLKERYRKASIKAALKVNKELLQFYWSLGRDLVSKKAEQRWGSGIVKQLSLDLQAEFPDGKGFSTTNLWYTKKWYSFYAQNWSELENQNSNTKEDFSDKTKKDIKMHQLGAQLENPAIIDKKANETKTDIKLQQVIGELEFPASFGLIPWGHHLTIITKCNSVTEALFYIDKTIKEGWSRKILISNIENDLYHRYGSIKSNFMETLSPKQGQLAQEILKDTYDLSFISLPKNYREGELEKVLEENITRFLLELGSGFSFMGREKELVVGGRSYRIDMLFYHIRLRAYVVVELKVVPFEPEFVGKLNFYVNAVDELYRSDMENHTIGLLICSGTDETAVKWTLKGMGTPIGVAAYEGVSGKEIEEALPSPEAIRLHLEEAKKEYLSSLKANRHED